LGHTNTKANANANANANTDYILKKMYIYMYMYIMGAYQADLCRTKSIHIKGIYKRAKSQKKAHGALPQKKKKGGGRRRRRDQVDDCVVRVAAHVAARQISHVQRFRRRRHRLERGTIRARLDPHKADGGAAARRVGQAAGRDESHKGRSAP